MTHPFSDKLISKVAEATNEPHLTALEFLDGAWWDNFEPKDFIVVIDDGGTLLVVNTEDKEGCELSSEHCANAFDKHGNTIIGNI